MVKNPSTSPSQNYYLGPLSESVHEMDGLSPKSWSVVHMDRWTDGRSADGRLRPRRPGSNEAQYLFRPQTESIDRYSEYHIPDFSKTVILIFDLSSEH